MLNCYFLTKLQGFLFVSSFFFVLSLHFKRAVPVWLKSHQVNIRVATYFQNQGIELNNSAGH